MGVDTKTALTDNYERRCCFVSTVLSMNIVP